MSTGRTGVLDRPASMDPRFRQRQAQVARHQGRWRRRVLLGVPALVLVAALAWFLFHSSLFSARVLRVTGSAHTPAATVLAAGGLASHPPLIDIDPGAVAARIERLPWVGTATVTRQWPDGVRVVVHERTPVAAIDLGTSGPARWAEVDRTGRVLTDTASPPAHLVRLVGPGAPAAPGDDVGAGDQAGLDVAATLPPAFAGQVTQVTVGAGDTVSLQLTTPLQVQLGSDNQLHAKYEDVAAILAGASLSAGEVIDVVAPGSPFVTQG